MKASSAYSIRDLKCQYPGSQHPVLHIDELDITRGKMSFFVGASGVGKSTILETLGLMSNTMVPKPSTELRFNPSDAESIDLNGIWDKGERAIAAFRKEYLSFIFQDMNLFFHLSMLQNVRLPGLLRGNASLTTNGIGSDLFDEVLPDIVSGELEDRSVVEMSGGQRQRLAFIRALSINFAVLFADEPTGNLDPVNAENLMKILAESKQSKKKTRIVVSHDINLALRYSDEIILIRKEPLTGTNKSIGVIDRSSKYVKTSDGSWVHIDQNISTTEAKNRLIDELQNQADL